MAKIVLVMAEEAEGRSAFAPPLQVTVWTRENVERSFFARDMLWSVIPPELRARLRGVRCCWLATALRVSSSRRCEGGRVSPYCLQLDLQERLRDLTAGDAPGLPIVRADLLFERPRAVAALPLYTGMAGLHPHPANAPPSVSLRFVAVQGSRPNPALGALDVQRDAPIEWSGAGPTVRLHVPCSTGDTVLWFGRCARARVRSRRRRFGSRTRAAQQAPPLHK